MFLTYFLPKNRQFSIEILCSFLNIKNLLLPRNTFPASQSEEYWWSQGGSRGPKEFWGSHGIPEVGRGLGGPRGSRGSWGVLRVPGLGPTFWKLKVGLSPSKKNCVICFIEPFKIIKSAFYFILKALFVLKIFKFLS